MSGTSTTEAQATPRPVHAPTLAGMAVALGDRGERPAMRFPGAGGTVQWTYADIGHRVLTLARALVALGIEPGDRVALLGNTHPEWTVADCAILATGAVVVPIYHTNSPAECAYVLTHSEAKAVLCENDAQLAKIEQIREECPALAHVLRMDRTPAEQADEDVVRARAAAVTPRDLATIVYTSGTTGPPKGGRLTHANVIETMHAYEHVLGLDESAVVFLFLPLAHALARVTQLVVLDIGGTLAYWGGDASRVIDEINAMRPTHVPAVPRVFEKIHTRALASVQDASGLQRRLFGWALKTGRRAREAERAGSVDPLLRAQHAIADRLVLSKVRGLFGGNLQLALTGAAPVTAEVLEFFDACGVLVLEGYGLTESCAAGTLNTPEAFRFGTVGRPLPGMQVGIADDGEVLLSGPIVFDGYHRDPDATAKTMDGGWLLTGDVGEVDPDGFLRITGRKKDLIITSSGKNISPSNIESALRESRWVSQAVVVGDNRPYLVALLTLDPDEAPALAAEAGIEGDITAMASDPRVLHILQGEVDMANSRFARIEQIKRFVVLDRDLTQSDGELTPTLKVKRQAVTDAYHDRIESMYSG